jgi:NADH:ubiquinone oxidoreductase subunit 6 (subunit J)
MTPALLSIGLLILVSAAVAMRLRQLIHSALLLVLSWFGVALFYLWAGAEFVAFGQILVYVGAVSMVVLFAVLLTRRSPAGESEARPAAGGRGLAALMTAAMVGAVLGAAVLTTRFALPDRPAPTLTVREIGAQLLGPHAAALLVVGAILTVALIGAVVIASTDPARRQEDKP